MTLTPLRLRVQPCLNRFLLLVLLTPTILICDDVQIDEVTAVARKTVDLRMEQVALESDWEYQKELLESTNAALQERLNRLTLERDLLVSKTEIARIGLDGLEEKNQKASQVMEGLSDYLMEVSLQLENIRAYLPPRLALALELPYASLSDASIAPGERLQYIMTILKRCGEFNRSVNYNEEIIALGNGGEEQLYEVVYWGMFQAYALDRNNKLAFRGYSDESGWTWKKMEGGYDRLAVIIDIYREETDPEFIEVPAQLGHSLQVKTPEADQ